MEQLRKRYSDLYVILAPPRSASTAFARAFWEQDSVAYYCHEPFEVKYFDDAPLADVVAKLETPLDLRGLSARPTHPNANALVVKEMPYQVGDSFPILAGLATRGVVFLLRDPRQNIASRMEMKEAVGDSPFFPLVESGWELLAAQLELCAALNVPSMIVDTNEFRNHPDSIMAQVFERIGLPFDPSMLSWNALPHVDLDNLGGRHSHLYRRVLNSKGIEPAVEPTYPIDWFPVEGGVRAHVLRCLEIYRDLHASDARIKPE